MIEGIGVDIVSIERIKKLYERFGKRFLTKIFTENEINYCLNYFDPIPHLAGRFAAKEAIIKALRKPSHLKLKNIEILNCIDGYPQAIVKDISIGNKKILVSISHEKTHTIAFAILTKN
jgi:holo-[acyl-carrier protein] synthase